MWTSLIISIVALIILSCIVIRVNKTYHQHREKLLLDVLNHDADLSTIVTHEQEKCNFSVKYRTRKGEVARMVIEATNDLEAQYLFIQMTELSYFKIIQVDKL